MEAYRYLVYDFLIQFYNELQKVKLCRGKVGKWEYLNDKNTKGLMVGLTGFLILMLRFQ